MAPRQRGLTLMPVLPSVRIFMDATLPVAVASGNRLGQRVLLEELPHGLVGIDEDDPPSHALQDPRAGWPGVEEAAGPYMPGTGESPQGHLGPPATVVVGEQRGRLPRRDGSRAADDGRRGDGVRIT